MEMSGKVLNSEKSSSGSKYKELTTVTTLSSKNSVEDEINHKQLSVSVSNNSYSSPKIGSRRIFTPQFKLQVLESYRNDNDCKGNQRATARKYNIHRRQIQKWLQCEASLRSSVANINQTTIKHQFHNVNVITQHHQSQADLPKYKAATSNNSNLNIEDVTCRYDQQYSISPILGEHKLTHSSSDGGKSTVGGMKANGVLHSSSNLAMVVAAVEEATQSMTIATSTLPTTTSTVISPLRPMAIVGGTSGITSAPLLHIPHHQHLYRSPSYTNLNSCLSIPMPFLSHQSAHQQNLQQPHTPYQYHHSHHHITPHLLAATSIESKLNETASETTSYPMSAPKIGNSYTYTITQPNNSITSTYIKTGLSNNKSVNQELLPKLALRVDQYKATKSLCPQQCNFLLQCPIDLSLGNRNELKNESNNKKHIHNIYTNSHVHLTELAKVNTEDIKGNNVVDLTFRKRKGIAMPKLNVNSTESTCFSDSRPKKQTKHIDCNNDNEESTKPINITHQLDTEVHENVEEEVDIEVDIDIVDEDKKIAPKPIKLFKPYLLDDEKYNCNANNDNNITANENKPDAPPLTHNPSNHQTADSNDSCNDSVTCNNFQTNEVFIRNGNFVTTTTVTTSTSSPLSAFSPTISVPTLSPTLLHYSKGSPLSSGYESSSSTYSECSSTRSEGYSSCLVHGRSYSHNLPVKIYNDNGIMSQSNHIQRWLDQDTSNQSATTSITLYA